jgi:hypothetical protein
MIDEARCNKHSESELRQKRYPGLFCIYCGERIVDVEVEAGQLAFKSRTGGRVLRYVAVVYQGRQIEAKSAQYEEEVLRVTLEGLPGSFRARPQALLKAFQDPSEVLSDLEPS